MKSARHSGGSQRIPVPRKLPEHPRLFLDRREIAGIRRKAKTDARTRRLVDSVVKFARGWCRKKFRFEGRTGEFYHVPRELALAYHLTGEKRFAEAAAEVLLAFADHSPNMERTYMSGFISSSTLEEGVFTSDLCWGYDLTIPAGILSKDERKHIEDDLFRPSGRIAGHMCNHPNSSNWHARGVVTLAATGLVTGDRELIDEALNGVYEPLRNAYLYGFAQQLAHVMRADGTIWETQVHYTYLTLSCMCYVAEMARHCGIDLWDLELPGLRKLPKGAMQTELGCAGPRNLRYALDSLFYRALPRQLFALTGNNQLTDLDGDPRILAAGYRQYGDPKYAWAVHREKRMYGHKRLIEEDTTIRRPYLWDLVYGTDSLPKGGFSFEPDVDIGLSGRHRNGCTIFPEGGYAVLRGKCDKVNATALEFHFGPHGSGHDHADKLGVTLYGQGRILAPDPGKMGYGDCLQGPWGKQTIAHNTVTIDEVSQYPQGDSDDMWSGVERGGRLSSGEMVFFHAGNEFKATRAICDNAYEGCQLDRTLILLDPLVIDIFRVTCDHERRIDLAWHGFGEAASNGKLVGRKRPPSSRLGYKLLENVRSARSSGPWAVTWRHQGRSLRMVQCSAKGAVHLLAATPTMDDPRSVAINRRKAAETVFVTVLEPFRKSPSLKDVSVSEVNGCLVVKLVQTKRNDTVAVPLEPVKCSNIECDEVKGSGFAAWSRQVRSGKLIGREIVTKRMPGVLRNLKR